jgi:hypothetical protein
MKIATFIYHTVVLEHVLRYTNLYVPPATMVCMGKDAKHYAKRLYKQAIGDPAIDETNREDVLEYVEEEADSIGLDGDAIREEVAEMFIPTPLMRFSKALSEKRKEQERLG